MEQYFVRAASLAPDMPVYLYNMPGMTHNPLTPDVLKKVCTAADIQLEYSWTPAYDSGYIEGINHLYEFDCGKESGWMYKVNDWFPNYGCSSYKVENGDNIVWCYTCNGYGEDVGSTWAATEGSSAE